MQGIKVAAAAAALLGAAASFGAAQATSIGTGLTGSPGSTVTRVEYQYHYPCFPWNSAWGYPGCEGYERHLRSEADVQCRVRETRRGLRRDCARRG